MQRRRFLTGIVAAALCLPVKSLIVCQAEAAGQETLFRTLIKVLDEQAHLYDEHYEQGNIANLRYGFDVVQPRRHDEYAFIVACSVRSYVSTADIMDEYARRRRGEAPRWMDHEVLTLEHRGLPNTQRILIYHEQAQALLMELHGSSSTCADSFRRRICERQSSLVEFVGKVQPRYRTSLSEEELETIYTRLEYYVNISADYVWCSTMVNRAMRQITA